MCEDNGDDLTEVGSSEISSGLQPYEIYGPDGVLTQGAYKKLVLKGMKGSVQQTENLIKGTFGSDDKRDVPITTLYPNVDVLRRVCNSEAADLRGAIKRIAAGSLTVDAICYACSSYGVNPFIIPEPFITDGQENQGAWRLLNPRRKQIAMALEVLGFYDTDDLCGKPVAFDSVDSVMKLVDLTNNLWTQIKSVELQHVAAKSRRATIPPYPKHLLTRSKTQGVINEVDGVYMVVDRTDTNLQLITGVLTYHEITSLKKFEEILEKRVPRSPDVGSTGRHSRGVRNGV